MATPADFDGYLMVAMLDRAPSLWLIKRAPLATCEECGKGPTSGQEPMYQTLDLDSRYALDLGLCHDCATRMWVNRLGRDDAPDPSGNRFHVYPPRAVGRRFRVVE